MNCASGQDSREINSVLAGTTLASITGKEDTVKSQFITREGTYKLMNSSDYCRTNRVGYNATPQTITPVKCSFVHLPGSPNNCDKICFNVGKDLYVYNYKGVKKATDLSKPIDKRSYKGTLPTCHDFNQVNISSDCVYLLVGFSAGQIQLVDPIKKEISKLYNEERLIDKTKVTCIKWAPGSMNLFLVSHSSGQLYVYKEDLPCGSTPPHYQIFKQGEGFSVYTCKAKSTRNPLYRWVIGEGSINEIAFSPCSNYLAVVSQDGFLRVFNYDTMELVGRVRSYFGGLLCVCWSPDSKFVVVGGEDDLVTVWSLPQKRVIARGQGHKSWVSVVAFDPFTTTVKQSYDSNASDDEVKSDVQVHSLCDSSSIPHNHHFNTTSTTTTTTTTTSTSNNSSSNSNKIPRNSPTSIVDSNHASSANHRSVTATSTVTKSTTFSSSTPSPASITSYRFGSVGQDTQICLWELTEDIIKQNVGRSRTSILLSSPTPGPNAIGLSVSGLSIQPSNNCSSQSGKGSNQSQANCISNNFSLFETNAYNHTTSNHTISRTTASEIKKEHKRNFSLASRSSDKNSLNKASHSRLLDDPIRLLGTSVCPRLDEVPLLEPLICKKIAHERLTSLVFREDCFVTACQEGYVFTWARPTRWESIQIAPSPTPSIGGDVNEVAEECGSTVV